MSLYEEFVVKRDGSLVGLTDRSPHGRDLYRTVEEMYGMIWYLAQQIADIENQSFTGMFDPKSEAKEHVEDAIKNRKQGLIASPTERYKA